MTISTLLKFRNIDSTKDINDRLKNMFSHGVVGDTGAINSIAISMSSITVTIDPFSAATRNGIVFYNEEPTYTTSTRSTDGFYLTYFEVNYTVGSITTTDFKIQHYFTEAAAISAYNYKWVKHAIFQVSGGVVVPTSLETAYDNTDRIDKFSRAPFKGTLATLSLLSGVNNTFYRTGDMLITLDTRELYVLEKGSGIGINDWDTLGIQDIEDCLGIHRGNGTVNKALCTSAGGVCFYDEKHLTEDQFDAVTSGTAVPSEEASGLSGGNPVVCGRYPMGKLVRVGTTLAGAPGGTLYNTDVDIAVLTGKVFTGLGTQGSTQTLFKAFYYEDISIRNYKQVLGDDRKAVELGCKYNGAFYDPNTLPAGTDSYGFLDVTVPLSFEITLKFSLRPLTVYKNTKIYIYYLDANDIQTKDTVLGGTQTYESLNKDFDLLDVIIGASNTTVYTGDFNYIPVAPAGALVIQDLMESLDSTLSATLTALSSHVTTVSGIATTLPDIRLMPTTGSNPYVGWRAYQSNNTLADSNQQFFSARIFTRSGAATKNTDFFEIADKGKVISRHQRYGQADWYTDTLGSRSGACFTVNHWEYHTAGIGTPQEYDQGYEYVTSLRRHRMSYAEWNSRHTIEDGPDASKTISNNLTYYITTVTSSVSANSMFVPTAGTSGFNVSDVGNYMYLHYVSGFNVATACNRLYKIDFIDYGGNPALKLSKLDGTTDAFLLGYSGSSAVFSIFSPNLQGSMYEYSPYYDGANTYDHNYHFKHLINLDNLICSASVNTAAHFGAGVSTASNFGAGTLYISPTWSNNKTTSSWDPDFPEHERYCFITKSYNVYEQLSATNASGYQGSSKITSYLRGDGCFNVESHSSGVQSIAGGCYLYGDLYNSGKYVIDIPGSTLQPAFSSEAGIGTNVLVGNPIINPVGYRGLLIGHDGTYSIITDFANLGAGGNASPMVSSVLYGARLPLQPFTNLSIQKYATIEEVYLDFFVSGEAGFPTELYVIASQTRLNGVTATTDTTLLTVLLANPGTPMGNRYFVGTTLITPLQINAPVYIYIKPQLAAASLGPIEIIGIKIRGTIYEPRQLG